MTMDSLFLMIKLSFSGRKESNKELSISFVSCPPYDIHETMIPYTVNYYGSNYNLLVLTRPLIMQLFDVNEAIKHLALDTM